MLVLGHPSFAEHSEGGEACRWTDRDMAGKVPPTRAVPPPWSRPASEAQKRLVSLSDSELSRPRSRVTLHLSAGQGVCSGRAARRAAGLHPQGAGNQHLPQQERASHVAPISGLRETV